MNETLELKVDGVPKLDEHCRRAPSAQLRESCRYNRNSAFLKLNGDFKVNCDGIKADFDEIRRPNCKF